MTIELSHEECEELTKLLETARRRIGPEIRHTDSREFREALKAESDVLDRLYDRLTAACAQ